MTSQKEPIIASITRKPGPSLGVFRPGTGDIRPLDFCGPWY